MSEESLREVESQRFVKKEVALDQRVGNLMKQIQNETDKDKLEELRLDLQEAIQEREIFKISTDTTGAKKGELFGMELRDMLEDNGLKRNEKGELVCEDLEALEGNHLLIVNMGELDRLNESGEHDLGDQGLEHVHYFIKDQIIEVLKERVEFAQMEKDQLLDKFEVYRTAGNDFSLVLKGMDERIVAEITKRLNGSMDLPEEIGQEAVPLSTASISMKDSFELLNHIRRAQGQEQVSPDDIENAADTDKTEMITLLRERLLTLGDAEKLNNRINRIIDKISNPSEKDTIDARDLYDKFLKKSLGNLFLEPGESGPQSFEEFKTALQKEGLLSGEGGIELNDRQKQRKILKLSQDRAFEQFQVYNQNSVDEEKALQKRVVDDFEDRAIGKGFDVRLHAKPIETAEQAKFGETEKDLAKLFDERLNEIGGKTSGRILIEQIKNELDEERTKVPPNQRKIKTIEKELYFTLLQKDQLTGLDKRGVYYQRLEDRINKGEPVGVIAIDMAFLKYFDKEGGRLTGDKAISTAALIMEYVANKFSEYDVKAFRLGGDEFSLSVNTDKKEILDLIVKEIKQVAEKKIAEIPMQEGATSRYKPEALQFNFGTAIYNAELHGTKKEGRRDRKGPADKLNHEADSRVEVDKAVNRFILLLQRSLQMTRMQSKEEKEKEAADLEVLFSYSEKAIFGKLGRDKIDEWTRDYAGRSIGLRKIMEELKEFIIEQLHEKGKEEIQDMEVMTIMVENQVLLDFKEKEISILQTQMQELLNQGVVDKQHITDLEVQLKTAEEDKRQVLSLRRQYKEAA